MNNKKFKQLIQAKIEKIEVKDFTKEILNSTSHQVKEVEEKKKLNMWMLPLSVSLVAATAVMISIPLGVLNNNDNTLVITKAEKVLSRELLALGNVIIEGSDVNLKSSNRRVKRSNQEDIIDYKKIAEDCNYYLLTGDALIYQDDINVVYENNTDTNYSSFDYKMNVSYKDHKQYEISYLAYFNQEIISNNKIEIEGTFVIDNKEYPLKGEEVKKEDEVELEMKVFTDTNSYISISNETEKNENEYEYKYVKDNEIIKGVEFSYEIENSRKEIEITIIENDSTVSYEFEYFDETIECEYEHNLLELEIEIYVHDQYYLYVFEDKTQIRLNKH